MSFGFSSEPSFKSLLVKENKATSAPEINAEQSRSTNNSAKPLTIEKSIAKLIIKKLEGSGSKDYIII